MKKYILRSLSLIIMLLLIGNTLKSQTASYGMYYYPYDNFNGNSTGAYSFRKCAHSGFILGGYRTKNIPPYANGYLVRVNDQGDSIWKRIYPETKIYQATPLLDNGFACITDDSLARMDSLGNILWTFNVNNIYFKSVCQLSDSGFAVLGERLVSNGNHYAIIIRFDSHGDTLWSHTYQRTLSIPHGNLIMQLPNGNILFAYQKYYNVVSTDLIIQRVSPNNVGLGTVTISGNGSGNRQIATLEPAAGGKFLMAYTLNSGSSYQTLFSKRDASNNIDFETAYTHPGSILLTACCEVGTGGVLLFNTGSGVRFIRTGVNGDSLWSVNINSPVYGTLYCGSSIYYRPSTNGFIFGGRAGWATIVCTDSLGNANNTFPYVHDASQAWSLSSGTIVINYNLQDNESDTCSLHPVFSTDSGYSWHDATPGIGGDGIQNLTSSPGSGTPHTFHWRSDVDFAGVSCASERVKVSLLARDRFSNEGNCDTINYHNLDNSNNADGCSWSQCLSSSNHIYWDGVFVDSLNGVAVGQYDFKRTTNGGQTWTTCLSSPGYIYHGIDTVDNHSYLACGEYSKIWKSIDGGLTWALKHNLGVPLYGINVTTDSTVYAVGGGGSPPNVTGVIFKSTNNGETWTSVFANTVPNNLLKASFINADTGIVVGGTGTMLRTNDGGSTWNVINISTSTDFYDALFLNKDSIIVVGGEINPNSVVGGRQIVLRSIDGGITWDSTFTIDDISSALTGVALSKTGVLFASGGYGRVYKSVDFGLHWQTVSNYGQGGIFWSVCVAGNDAEYAFGQVYITTGVIYRTSIGQPLANNETINEDEISIYPNPASDELFVTINGAEIEEEILFEIFSPAGQLLKYDFVKNNSKSNILVADLAEGIYFYSIKQEGVILKTGKFIKM